MPIKYVIQVILSICQDSRFYGPSDRVKSIVTTVQLSFTPSRLFFYINHLAKEIRYILALAFLLALTVNVHAQTSKTYSTAGSYTFTPAAGVTSVTVECWGGGGAGGGGIDNHTGGAGGGGGGGYSRSSNLPVNVSTPYSVNVGAGGSGTTAIGGNGEDSWFNTNTTILAKGGNGGYPPSTIPILDLLGGLPGLGGTLGIGDVSYSGGNGGIGKISSGTKTGHGGPGGSSAGNAGNGTSGSFLLWTTEIAQPAPIGGGKGGNGGLETINSGNAFAGSVPGGGGGGSGDKINATPGNAAAGQVIITFTCPTYNLTGTSATDVCASVGTSVINLTSTPAGLPIGDFTITYDRSSPSGTGLTAPMTVTTEGSGSFTATGFNVIGNSTITITKITSEDCSSLTTLNNTATILVSSALPGTGTIVGTSSVCQGATGVNYIVPVITDATGYLWTLPTGATITAGDNTNSITVSFSLTAVSGNITVYGKNACGNGPISPNYFVTVNPILPASVSIAASANPICDGTSVTFTASPTNEGITPTYKWKKGGTDIPGETNPTYTSTTLASNDVISVEMTSTEICATGSPATSNLVTMIVTPSVGTPVFVLGASSARDQGVGPVTYTANATNNTGITYSLDAASLAGGNTIDAFTGEVTYTALWSWKSIITATVTGCGGPKIATHIVGVNWCYALFTANGALSCAGASTITGNVGTFVGATTGFLGPGSLIPPGHIDPQATPESAQAAAQTIAVYNDLAAIPCTASPAGITLSTSTLAPNVYCYGGALTISGDITLNGGPNTIFIFKINGALTTTTGSKIIMSGGASYRNVYWRVYGAVVLSGLEFEGTIVNEGAFTVNTGAALEGRALSINGAIAITDNIITSDCYPLFTQIDNTKPTFVPPGDINECVENLFNIDYNPLTTVINPDRPDYYTFSHGDTRLDLNTALFTDEADLSTCPPVNIRWQIDFSPASDLNPPYALVTLPPVTGLGQPSDHPGNILFPGNGVNFNPVVHHITWWIKDCAGNESPPQTRSITINPRPKIQ